MHPCEDRCGADLDRSGRDIVDIVGMSGLGRATKAPSQAGAAFSESYDEVVRPKLQGIGGC